MYMNRWDCMMPENTLSSSLIFRALIWLKSCMGTRKCQRTPARIFATHVKWFPHQSSKTQMFRKSSADYAGMHLGQTIHSALPTCMKMKVLKTTELDLVRSSL